MKWQSVPLDQICEINIGKTPSRSVRDYWGEGHPWLSIADMNQGTIISKTKEQITDKAIKDTKIKLVLPGTILLSYKLSIGKIGIADRVLYTNEAIAALPIKDESKVNPQFLMWALRAYDFHEGSDRAAMGLTFNKEKLRKILIPLPSINEQMRIAAILDKADEVRVKRRLALEKLEGLAQAVFVEMFGEPSIAYEGGQSIKNIAELINGDRSSNYPSGDDIVSEGILFLSTKNIWENELNITEAQFITAEKFNSLTRGKLQRNDLVITLRGSLGQCCKFDCEFDTGFINAQMMIIRCGSKVLPDFLKALITHPKIQKKLKGLSSGSAVPQLTAKQISDFHIYVPPLTQQQIFTDFVNRLNHNVKLSNRHVILLESAFSSLQQRAFRREL